MIWQNEKERVGCAYKSSQNSSMAQGKSMSCLDVNRVLRFPATVMAGELNLTVDDRNCNGGRKGRDQFADADVEDRRATILRNLLLRPDRLRNFKNRGRSEALTCQHREVPHTLATGHCELENDLKRCQETLFKGQLLVCVFFTMPHQCQSFCSSLKT